MLNRSKGAAMWSPRAQCDKGRFSAEWRHELENTQNLYIWQDTAAELLFDTAGERPRVTGVRTCMGVEFTARAVTHYRTQKAKKDLEFTENVLKESRSAYYKAQQAYAAFEDGNKNIISASYRTEQERLRNEMTLTFNVYNTLAQKLEQDKLRVQEQTPVYTIIEPATVPLKASSPKKLLILVAFIFLAFIGGCGYLIIKEYAIPPSPRSET